MSLRDKIDRAVRESSQAENVELRLQEWKAAVSELYRDIENWLSVFIDESGIHLVRDVISVHEDLTGQYEIERLDIEIGNEVIRIEPKGTYVIGAMGRLDIYRLGHGQPTLIIRGDRGDGTLGWMTVSTSDRPALTALTKESFEELMDGYLEDYAPQSRGMK